MSETGKYNVLFICLGNICRSPAAQAVMQAMVDERGLSDRFYIDSAGIGGWHIGDLPDKRMRVHARPRGYELTHRARKVRSADFEDFDLIVGMDASNVDDLCNLAMTLEQQDKVVMMGDYIRRYPNYDHVPDPYYEGSEGFELVLDLLEDACDNLLDRIIEQNNIVK
jgi:protein-tyrosine phosphatase